MNLDTRRMKDMGPLNIDGYNINLLYGLNELCLKYVNKDMDVLELGTNIGVSTELFCSFAKNVVSVDVNRKEEIASLIERNKNLIFHEDTFENFFNKCTHKFDLIYIDGRHSYHPVKADIINSLNFIKIGGYISGHDMSSLTPGVEKAVTEFFPKKEIEIFSDSSWIVKIG